MKFKNTININHKNSKIIYTSILPELLDKKYLRSNINMKLNKNQIIVNIESKDLNALRASFNNIMRLIITNDKTLNIGEK